MAIDEKALEVAARKCWPGAFLFGQDRAGAIDATRAILEAYEAAKAAPAEGEENATDLVSRAEVLRVIRTLGEQDADLALYGAADNARAREYGEAAATRACCAIALMPTPAPAEGREAVAVEPEGIRDRIAGQRVAVPMKIVQRLLRYRESQPYDPALSQITIDLEIALAHPAPAAPAPAGEEA